MTIVNYDTPSLLLWVVMDSNHRRHRQQIYSLPHLATLVTTRFLKAMQRYAFILKIKNVSRIIYVY